MIEKIELSLFSTSYFDFRILPVCEGIQWPTDSPMGQFLTAKRQANSSGLRDDESHCNVHNERDPVSCASIPP